MSCVLYSGTKNASSGALRAWLALREQGIAFEERVVDIRRPQRLENLAGIAEFSPPGAVPVLVDDEVVIFDSLAIMEYASEIGRKPLLPADVRLRAFSPCAFTGPGSFALAAGPGVDRTPDVARFRAGVDANRAIIASGHGGRIGSGSNATSVRL